MHVLLVENNKIDKSESLSSSLTEQGHEVWLARTPKMAAKETTDHWPNLVVFHVAPEQPDLDVFQEAVNETRLNIPQIFVGDKKHLPDEIGGIAPRINLDKPQQLDKTILKATAKQKDRFLRFPGLIVDCRQLNVRRNGKDFSLTPKEFKLLHLLISNHTEVISRKIIMQKVWETDYMGDTRTLDVHIRWIREKIEENPSRPKRLITIRGLGYRFIVNPDTD